MFALTFLVYREQVSLNKATLELLERKVLNDAQQTIIYYRTNETLQSILTVAARPRSAATSDEDLTAEEEGFATLCLKMCYFCYVTLFFYSFF